jgi:hypothetical protein
MATISTVTALQKSKANVTMSWLSTLSPGSLETWTYIIIGYDELT